VRDNTRPCGHYLVMPVEILFPPIQLGLEV